MDLRPTRLDFASQLGATDVVQANAEDRGLVDVAQQIKQITGRGADYAFECTAVPELGSSPLRMIRNGGMAVAVSGVEQTIPFDMELFEWDKRYINPLYGQCRPSVDFPALLRLYSQGRLKLDEMVSREYSLSQLGQAFCDMKSGIHAKGVLLPHMQEGAPKNG